MTDLMMRPAVVNQALKLLYFSLALSFANIFVSYTDSMKNPEMQEVLPLLASFADPATLFIGAGIFFWLSFVFLAWLLARGSKGARFFLVLSVVFALFGAASEIFNFQFKLGTLLSLAITFLQTYSCILFYRAESSAWFKVKAL